MMPSSPALVWSPHPVFPVPARAQAEALLAQTGPDEAHRRLSAIWREREALIALEQNEPLYVPHQYEPAPFARARALLAEFDELAILGQNRSGKTLFTVKYALEDLVHLPNRAWAFFHLTEESSVNQQQKLIHRFLPADWRSLGRQGEKVYVQYTEATGFSNRKFILPNGSTAYFFNYKQDLTILEGYEFDGVLFDELVPLPFLETARYRRGRGRPLKILVSFTPRTGYTDTVGSLVEGGTIVETLPATLLAPDVQHVRGCPPGHMPYVMQCRRRGSRVMWFHWGTNPYGAHAEVRQGVEGQSSATVKMRCYGWVDRMASNAFPRYGAAHRITRAQFAAIAARGGTRYVYCDPGFDKNWFIIWVFVTPAGHRIVYREWPDLPRYDEWALPPSETTGDAAAGARKWDWRRGPAQVTDMGGSINRYKTLILEAEGHVWVPADKRWDSTSAEPIARRLFDPRLGGERVPNQDEGTSIIDLCAAASTDPEGRPMAPMYWDEASACGIGEGIQLINLALAYDDTRPVTMENCPRLYLVDDCQQLDLALSSYVPPPATSERNALKDPIDCLRYCLKDDFGHLSAELLRARRATYY
jgi:hypothetical protein